MFIAIHLSVYLRYIDNIIGDYLQSKIQQFLCKVISNIRYVFMMAVRCPLLFTCLYISDN